jgi:hypothetical protein
MQIRSVGAELFHDERRTDRQTDMMKLIVAFRNFANAPKNGYQHNLYCYYYITCRLIRRQCASCAKNLTQKRIKTAFQIAQFEILEILYQLWDYTGMLEGECNSSKCLSTK